MRHLWSLLAGLVAAPLAWVLLALAQDGSTSTIGRWEQRAAFDTAELIVPGCYLAAAGVLLGLIATLRISPLGPVVAGLLLTTVYGLMFVNPFRVHDALPEDWSFRGEPVPLMLPLDNGTLGLVGLLLLMAVFSAQRWRRWPATAPVARPAEVTTEAEPDGVPAAGNVWVPPGRDAAEQPATVPLSAQPLTAEPPVTAPPTADAMTAERDDTEQVGSPSQDRTENATPDQPQAGQAGVPAGDDPAVESPPPDEPAQAVDAPAPAAPRAEPAAPAEPELVSTEPASTEPAHTEPAVAAEPAPGPAPESAPALATADTSAAPTAEEDDQAPARRRPLPRPRRATSDGREAVPSESPWVAPPRPTGPDTMTE